MTEEAEKTARIVSPKERAREVKLDWPVEFDGTTYESITVRRVTGLEVENFIDAINAAEAGGARAQPPMIDCPYEVYVALDDDDRIRLEEAMVPFLPRRLLDVAASILATAEPSSGG